MENCLELSRITKRWFLIDRLRSRLRSYNSNRQHRYDVKRKMLNTYEKIKRMINDCHHKASKWISEHYNKVLLPFLKTKDIVKGKMLAPVVKRRLFAWSHYSFKELLKVKMERLGNKLIECTEEYTSKTCTSCGIINRLLGISKKFICPFINCGKRIDRDIGAARSIYLKNHEML